MPVVHLADRALIEVFGAEAEPFLQNILTTDLGTLGAGELKPGALLTPQGKILAAFLIARRGEGFVLDTPAVLGDELLRRLTLYKLRAKLEIRKLAPGLAAVGWDLEPTLTDAGSGLRDLRFGTRAVWRRYTDLPAATDSEAAWDLLRIGAAVGEIGVDYQPGEAFPHDVLLDQLGGVGFKKGCYVGQEVVSRMQHRGTARRRLLHVEAAAPLPATGHRDHGRRPTARSARHGAGRQGTGDRTHRSGQGRARQRRSASCRRCRRHACHSGLGDIHLSRNGRRRGRSLMPDRPGAPPRAWQRMLSGRRLDLLDPSPLDIEISDIAHGLARVARWNGQTHGDARLFGCPAFAAGRSGVQRARCPGVAPAQQLAALLHDAPEYVIGDMISPFKSVVGGSYKEVRTAPAAGHPFALRACRPSCLPRCAGPSSAPTRSPPISRRPRLAGFSAGEAGRFFGRPHAASAAQRFDLASRPAQAVQKRFLARFLALETARERR